MKNYSTQTTKAVQTPKIQKINSLKKKTQVAANDITSLMCRYLNEDLCFVSTGCKGKAVY